MLPKEISTFIDQNLEPEERKVVLSRLQEHISVSDKHFSEEKIDMAASLLSMPAFYAVFIPTLMWAIPKFVHSIEQMDPETQKIFIVLSIFMWPYYALPIGILGAPACGAYAASFLSSREILKRTLLPLRKKFVHNPGIEAFMRAEYGYQPERV